MLLEIPYLVSWVTKKGQKSCRHANIFQHSIFVVTPTKAHVRKEDPTSRKNTQRMAAQDGSPNHFGVVPKMEESSPII